jgi:hypothetical protein
MSIAEPSLIEVITIKGLTHDLALSCALLMLALPKDLREHCIIKV